MAQVSFGPYQSTAQMALVGSAVLGVLILLAVTVAAYVLITRSLSQVTHMTEWAQAWSVADNGRRFDLGRPRDELSRRAATLDVLLARVASSLRHEQRFSAEVSHELRNAQQMARTLDTLAAATCVELGAPRGTDDATRAAPATRPARHRRRDPRGAGGGPRVRGPRADPWGQNRPGQMAQASWKPARRDIGDAPELRPPRFSAESLAEEC